MAMGRIQLPEGSLGNTYEIVDLSNAPFPPPAENETIFILPAPQGYTMIRATEEKPSCRDRSSIFGH